MNMYSSSHPVAFPWTTSTGWSLGSKFAISFGNPGSSDRTAYIWAFQFMKEQLKEDFVFELRIGYYKDTSYAHAPDPVWINPITAPDDQTGHTFTVTPDSLDANGIFWLKDGNSPQGFVASRVLIERKSGPSTLNFDFVGTFYDFETAIDNKHADDKSDDYNSLSINEYWVRDVSGASFWKSKCLCNILFHLRLHPGKRL